MLLMYIAVTLIFLTHVAVYKFYSVATFKLERLVYDTVAIS